jgi:hypothetical protein
MNSILKRTKNAFILGPKKLQSHNLICKFMIEAIKKLASEKAEEVCNFVPSKFAQ